MNPYLATHILILIALVLVIIDLISPTARLTTIGVLLVIVQLLANPILPVR